MKKDLGLVIGLGIFAGVAAFLLAETSDSRKKSAQASPLVPDDLTDEERQLLHGEMPGRHLNLKEFDEEVALAVEELRLRAPDNVVVAMADFLARRRRRRG